MKPLRNERAAGEALADTLQAREATHKAWTQALAPARVSTRRPKPALWRRVLRLAPQY